MTGVLHEFRRSYASAFDKYVLDPAEDALHSAYELGREAVRRDLSVLDLAGIHHDVLLTALAGSRPPSETDSVVRLGRAFFVESLSAFEMVQRGFREIHETALVEKRHAEILRQLSNFLADASLAFSATESLAEILQLVAEQARELIGAECCVAWAFIDGGERPTLDAISHSEEDPTWRDFIDEADLANLSSLIPSAGNSLRIADGDFELYPTWHAATGKCSRPIRGWLGASLTGWDERHLGFIQLFDKHDGEFSEVDEAVLVHLAQMASAAVERAQLYREAGARRDSSEPSRTDGRSGPPQ